MDLLEQARRRLQEKAAELRPFWLYHESLDAPLAQLSQSKEAVRVSLSTLQGDVTDDDYAQKCWRNGLELCGWWKPEALARRLAAVASFHDQLARADSTHEVYSSRYALHLRGLIARLGEENSICTS